jgi:serine/threonine protein kinase
MVKHFNFYMQEGLVARYVVQVRQLIGCLLLLVGLRVIGLQILWGLQYLHEQGVIHRDIKAANILTTKDGQVKLADFGVAKLSRSFGDENAEADVAGSPYWMAPELISSETASSSADIWSLGCTIIELLTGKPPYFDMQPFAAMYQIVQANHPPFPDNISPELTDFLLKCFQHNPAERATASELLSHAWLEQSLTRLTNQHMQSVPPTPLPELEDTNAGYERSGSGKKEGRNSNKETARTSTKDKSESPKKRKSSSQKMISQFSPGPESEQDALMTMFENRDERWPASVTSRTPNPFDTGSPHRPQGSGIRPTIRRTTSLPTMHTGLEIPLFTAADRSGSIAGPSTSSGSTTATSSDVFATLLSAPGGSSSAPSTGRGEKPSPRKNEMMAPLSSRSEDSGLENILTSMAEKLSQASNNSSGQLSDDVRELYTNTLINSSSSQEYSVLGEFSIDSREGEAGKSRVPMVRISVDDDSNHTSDTEIVATSTVPSRHRAGSGSNNNKGGRSGAGSSLPPLGIASLTDYLSIDTGIDGGVFVNTNLVPSADSDQGADNRRALELVKLMNKIRPHLDASDNLNLCSQLMAMCDVGQRQIDIMMSTVGVMPIIEMLEAQASLSANYLGAHESEVRRHVVRIVNKIIENNPKVQEQLALMGIIPIMLKLFTASVNSPRSASSNAVNTPASSVRPGLGLTVNTSGLNTVSGPLSTVYTPGPASVSALGPASVLGGSALLASDSRRFKINIVNPIVLEVSRFIHMTALSSSLSTQMLIGSGGLPVFVDMISYSSLLHKKLNAKLTDPIFVDVLHSAPQTPMHCATPVPTVNHNSLLSSQAYAALTTHGSTTPMHSSSSSSSQHSQVTATPGTAGSTSAESAFGSSSSSSRASVPNTPHIPTLPIQTVAPTPIAPFSMKSHQQQQAIFQQQQLTQLQLGPQLFRHFSPGPDAEPLDSVRERCGWTQSLEQLSSSDEIAMVFMGIDCVDRIFIQHSTRSKDFCRSLLKLSIMSHLAVAFRYLFGQYISSLASLMASSGDTHGTHLLSNKAASFSLKGNESIDAKSLARLDANSMDSQRKLSSHSMINNREYGIAYATPQLTARSHDYLSDDNNSNNNNGSTMNMMSGQDGHYHHHHGPNAMHSPVHPAMNAQQQAQQYQQHAGQSIDYKYSHLIASLFVMFARSEPSAVEKMAQSSDFISVMISIFQSQMFRPQTSSAIKFDRSKQHRDHSHHHNAHNAGAPTLPQPLLDIVEMLLTAIRSITAEPLALVRLENSGILVCLVHLLNGPLHGTCENLVLQSIFNLCRINRSRQERAATHGIIPHLKRLIEEGSQFKQIALPIVLDLAHTSNATRLELWKHDMVPFYIQLLRDPFCQAQALNSLAVWYVVLDRLFAHRALIIRVDALQVVSQHGGC